MDPLTKEENEAIELLYDTGCLLFGKYKLRSGLEAPYYIDLRRFPLHRQLVKSIGKLFCEKFLTSQQDRNNTLLCGIPLGGIFLSEHLSEHSDLPSLPLRKEENGFAYPKGMDLDVDRTYEIVIIDDVISSGHSIQQMINFLKQEKYNIKSVCVFVERQQNGLEMLKANNKDIQFKYLFTISDILKSLQNSGRISEDTASNTLKWINEVKL